MEFPTGIDPLGVIFTGDTGDSVKDTGAVDVVGMNPLSSCLRKLFVFMSIIFLIYRLATKPKNRIKVT